MPDFTVRPAESDADLEAWCHVRRLVVPNESAPTVKQLRAEESPIRLMVLVESVGVVVGSGLADRSQITGSFVAPRIVPEHRRRGAGTAVLRALLDHVQRHGFQAAGSHVVDDGSFAFARAHGFEEVDRQIEQVLALDPNAPAPAPYPGVDFTTIATKPELLEKAFPLAEQGFADMVLTTGPAVARRDEWLREEATLPAGSIVAIAAGQIVGYAGLLAWNDDTSLAENGLTVVDRAWRGRGLATALKRRQMAWAAANGIREIVTWTQQGNEAMQQANLNLGYVNRTISRTMRRDLP